MTANAKRKAEDEAANGVDDPTAVIVASDTTPRSSKRSKLPTIDASDLPDSQISTETTTPSKNASTPKSASKAEKEDMNWVCAECKEAECLLDPTAEEFLLCDGGCHRIFHIPCAGLSQLPDSDQDWICKDCSQKSHQCAFCHQYGADDVDVFACRKDDCGLFFHEACLALNNVEYKMEPSVRSVSGAGSVADEEGPSPSDGLIPTQQAPVFVCPAHCCWTCTQKEEMKKEKEQLAAEAKGKKRKKGKQSSIYQSKTESRLFRCLYCPWASHVTCIPPTSQFHELAILCPEHSTMHKLPDLDLSTSLQGTLEDKMDQTMLQINGAKRAKRRFQSSSEGNPFCPGLRGDRFQTPDRLYLEYLTKQQQGPPAKDQSSADIKSDSTTSMKLPKRSDMLTFCLPTDIRKEIHAKPPTYTHIHGLRYQPNHRPKRIPATGEQCHCTDICGEQCFNKLTLVECHGEGPNSNCRLGAKRCHNRGLGKRQFVKCKPQREAGKGWGLITLEDVPEGKLVLEYVGEVIDEKEKDTRLTDWGRDHPNDPNFYIMGLGSGWYVDARECANMSRFINHSCNPNCYVTTMNVNGWKHNGIYAKRDLKAGEFLCYDYHFDTKHADQFLCRCGADNCRGTMKGMQNGKDPARKQSWKEAKARYDQDCKTLKELMGKEVSCQVSSLVPGAEQPTELVSAGPADRHRDTAMSNRIFLWRNARRGADFLARFSRMEQRMPPQAVEDKK